MNILLIFLVLLVLLTSNIRIYLAVFASILVYFFFEIQNNPYLPWGTAIQQVISPAANVNLLAIPFFMLLGSLMNYTGISSRLLTIAEMLVGKFIGGLAQANILLSTMMGGLSASNLADSAMLTKMLVPEMERQGYNRGFAGGVTAASSLITPIIPPGIALILYGLIADVSIKQMFLAGIIPGLLCMIILMFATYYVSKKHGYKPTRKHFPKIPEFGKAMWDALPAFILIISIIGGIRFGLFTATEAGAFAVVFAIITGLFIYKEMKPSHIFSSFSETVQSTAAVMIVIMTCSALGWILKNERTADSMTQFILSITSNKWIFLAVINIALLMMGTIMEGNALMLIIVPLLKPVLLQMGIDPVHFGIIVILNLSIGTLTPPIGTVMLLVCRIGRIDVWEFLKSSWILYVALVFALFLITYIPSLSLFLPAL